MILLDVLPLVGINVDAKDYKNIKNFIQILLPSIV